MFVPSNHTLLPISKPLNFDSLIIASCVRLRASCACSLASLINWMRALRSGTAVVSLDGWWASGVYPKINSYGDFFVDALGHEFLVYWASGNHAAQSFWCVPQYRHRYCSRDWFVLSLWPSVCGWYADEMFCLIPSKLHISQEKLEAKRGSLSEMTFFGRP